MTMIDITMVVFLTTVAIIGVGWLIYESLSDDEK